ncbi:YggS family pyridoxal phosphate-dependent enzyme [Propionibacteriaceae bacterium Y1685]
MTLADNLAAVRQRIDRACDDHGRDRSEVRLLPVSKTVDAEAVRQAYAAGVRTFGENRVQEVKQKAEALADLADLRWAVIGPLQTNKAKVVAELAHEFHALDSVRVAEALDKRLRTAGRTLEVLIQVNSSGEDTKSGLPPERVVEFAAGLADFSHVQVRGLMTLAANSTDRSEVEACFVRMAELREQLRGTEGLPGTYEELSMGMSGDFELAIAHGSTCVRVGTAIFGARPPV